MEKIELSKYLSSHLYASRLCPYAQRLARRISTGVYAMVEPVKGLAR